MATELVGGVVSYLPGFPGIGATCLKLPLMARVVRKGLASRYARFARNGSATTMPGGDVKASPCLGFGAGLAGEGVRGASRMSAPISLSLCIALLL